MFVSHCKERCPILTQHKEHTPPISSDLLPAFQPALPAGVVGNDGISSDGSSGDAPARAMFGDRVRHQQMVDGGAVLPGGATCCTFTVRLSLLCSVRRLSSMHCMDHAAHADRTTHTHTHTHAHFMKAPLSSSHAQIAGRARAGTFRERTSVTLLAPRRTSEMRAPGHDPLQIAPLPTTCGSAVGVSSGGVSGVDIARDRRPRDRRPRQRQAPPPLHARPHLRRLTLARPRLARHPPRMATHRSVQRGATGNGTLASHAASIRVTLTTSPTLYAVPATRSTALCVHAVCPARDSRFAVTSVCWTCSERSTVA